MIHNLSNADLIHRFGELVRRERKITHHILLYIIEIETRELHLAKAYPSMYEFLIHEFGYSQSAAGRRIGAARLLKQVPEVAHKIEDGTLNLSQASLLTQSIRASEKQTGSPVTTEQKRAILQKIEHHTFQDTQKIICQELGVSVQIPDKTRTHGDGSVTLTLTLSAEQAQRWQQVKELASHAIDAQNAAALMDYLATKEIARRTEIKRSSPQRKNPSLNPRAIAPNVRKQLLQRSTDSGFSEKPISRTGSQIALATATCEYQDKGSGKHCASKHFLQLDHRQPVWSGGHRNPENLQWLCSQHNRWKYRNEAGIRAQSKALTDPRQMGE